MKTNFLKKHIYIRTMRYIEIVRLALVVLIQNKLIQTF